MQDNLSKQENKDTAQPLNLVVIFNISSSLFKPSEFWIEVHSVDGKLGVMFILPTITTPESLINKEQVAAIYRLLKGMP